MPFQQEPKPLPNITPPKPTGVVTGIASASDGEGIGVYGESDTPQGIGVWGFSKTGTGVKGESDSSIGVKGVSVSSQGVQGISETSFGVLAQSASGIGLFATGKGGAAQFEGTVYVKGGQSIEGELGATRITTSENVFVGGTLFATVDVVLGADCAEEFDVAPVEEMEPGTVVVLSDEGPLLPSSRAYDRRVAGVISGAGEYQPGLIMDRKASAEDRRPVALIGKVYCKVDARYAPVEVGDLLTTSPTPGHAMKAADPAQAFGAVIGKALRPLRQGQDLIPVLIALQ